MQFNTKFLYWGVSMFKRTSKVFMKAVTVGTLFASNGLGEEATSELKGDTTVHSSLKSDLPSLVDEKKSYKDVKRMMDDYLYIQKFVMDRTQRTNQLLHQINIEKVNSQIKMQGGNPKSSLGLGKPTKGYKRVKPFLKTTGITSQHQARNYKEIKHMLPNFLQKRRAEEEANMERNSFIHEILMGKVFLQMKERGTLYKHGLKPAFRHVLLDPFVIEDLNALRQKPGELNTELYRYMILEGPGRDVHNWEISKDVKHHLMLMGREGIVRREVLRQPRVIDLKVKSVDSVLNFLWNARKYSVPDDMVKVSLKVINATEGQLARILSDENSSFIDENQFEWTYRKAEGTDPDEDEEDEDNSKKKSKYEDEDEDEEEYEKKKFFDDEGDEDEDEYVIEFPTYDAFPGIPSRLLPLPLRDEDEDEKRTLVDEEGDADEDAYVAEYPRFDPLVAGRVFNLPRLRKVVARRREAPLINDLEEQSSPNEKIVIIEEEKAVLENVIPLQDKVDLEKVKWKITPSLQKDSTVDEQKVASPPTTRSQSQFTPHTSHNYVHIFCRGRTPLDRARAMS